MEVHDQEQEEELMPELPEEPGIAPGEERIGLAADDGEHATGGEDARVAGGAAVRSEVDPALT